jgi:hypothetical protein
VGRPLVFSKEEMEQATGKEGYKMVADRIMKAISEL